MARTVRPTWNRGDRGKGPRIRTDKRDALDRLAAEQPVLFALCTHQDVGERGHDRVVVLWSAAAPWT